MKMTSLEYGSGSHSLSHSHPHSLTHSLTHSLSHSPTHSLSLTHPLTLSLTHSLSLSPIFSLPPNYPSVPPVIEIETNESGTFTYSDADSLYDRLMEEANQHIGATMVFDLVGTTLDLLPDMLQQRRDRIARQEAADQERKTQIELTDAINSKRKGFIPANVSVASSILSIR